MSKREVVAILAAALALAALPAAADDGATPIPFTDPYTTPQILTQPGHYVVTRNLLPAPAGPILVVECNAPADPAPAPAYTIDLNGMVLDNTGGAEEVILVVGNPVCEVIIRNGELIGGIHGIHVPPAGLRKLVVEDVEIKDSQGEGILCLEEESFAIRRNTVVETGGMGIVMAGGMLKTGVIEDNIVRRTQGGIYVDIAQGLEISNNRVSEIGPGPFNGVGIYLMDVGSCLVTQNNVAMVTSDGASPGGDGIALYEGSECKLYNNTVNRTEGRGIFIDPDSGDNLVLDNHVRDATANGIHIESPRNHVQRNVTNWCGGIGLYYVGQGALFNSVGRNYANGNGWAGPPPCPIGPVFPDFCDDTGTFVTQGDNVFAAGPF